MSDPTEPNRLFTIQDPDGNYLTVDVNGNLSLTPVEDATGFTQQWQTSDVLGNNYFYCVPDQTTNSRYYLTPGLSVSVGTEVVADPTFNQSTMGWDITDGSMFFDPDNPQDFYANADSATKKVVIKNTKQTWTWNKKVSHGLGFERK